MKGRLGFDPKAREIPIEITSELLFGVLLGGTSSKTQPGMGKSFRIRGIDGWELSHSKHPSAVFLRSPGVLEAHGAEHLGPLLAKPKGHPVVGVRK